MKRRVTVWSLIFCLLLGGCSWASSGGELEGGPAALFVLRGTKPVVKIGLVAPFEGRYRSLGYEVLYAVKWAVRQRNAAGGVAGYMVELVALDDGDAPDSSAFQARKLAVDDRVMGVIGPFSEAAALAAAPVFHESGLGAIAPVTCSPSLGSVKYRETFCLGAGAGALSRAMIERLPAEASVTLVRAGEGSLGDCLLPQARQVVHAPWDAGTLDALRAQGADVYLYDGDVLAAADLLVKMREAGIDAPLWGGPSLARTQLSQIAGHAAAGVCHALTAPLFADLSLEGAFVRGYQGLAGTPPGPWAALAYDATVLLLDALQGAIEAQGQPTREGVIAQVAVARGPDGQPVFVDGQRRQADVTFYCYQVGDRYPGTLRR